MGIIHQRLLSHGRCLDALAILSIIGIVVTACLPVLTSGERLNFNRDFLQYAARHEQVRQGILRYHTLPQRTHFFGGGFPTIADPEDPTFNPLILFTLSLGTIVGLKWIGLVSILFGACSLYVFARQALGTSRWGALAAGLFFGLCLWLPVRLRDGNPNEVYTYFIPACLLCLYTVRRRKSAVLWLTALLMTMLSDGKLTFVASVMYLGLLCGVALLPGLSLWSATPPSARVTWHERCNPLQWLLLSLALTFLLDLFRLLPALELIQLKGGLARMDLYFHAKTYAPDTIAAYSFPRLWREAVAWHGEAGLKRLTSVYIGWIPLLLAAYACLVNWRRAMPWLAALLFFTWLAMAHQAPVDLFRYLWHLPVLNAISNPAKYFGCLPVLSVCVLAGQGLDRLRAWRRAWLRQGVALVVVAAGVWCLFPKVWDVSRLSYTYTIPPALLVPSEHFYQVRGENLKRERGPVASEYLRESPAWYWHDRLVHGYTLRRERHTAISGDASGGLYL